jgi:hypothetical protein
MHTCMLLRSPLRTVRVCAACEPGDQLVANMKLAQFGLASERRLLVAWRTVLSWSCIQVTSLGVLKIPR